MDFTEIIQKRYAVKLFDKDKKLNDEQLNYVLEAARMAPTSFGLQPFRIKVVSDDETKTKLQEASWNQSQVGTASQVLVFCADNDVMTRIKDYGDVMDAAGMPAEKKQAFMDMMKGSFAERSAGDITSWAARQAYLAADHAMLACVAKGFNSCPMEGFDAASYVNILGLPAHLMPVIVLPIGYPADEVRPKMRFPQDKLFI